MARIWTPIVVIFCVSTISCSRPISEDLSTIAILAPESGAFGKVGSLSLPANRKACYGVNITGPNITSTNGNSCSPATGTIAGFVEPGAVLEANVLKGPQRKIDLYVYLQPVGQNTPCPNMTASFSADQLTKTYFLGSTTVELSQPTQTVDITATFPGEANTIAQHLSLPTACTTASSGNLPGFGVSSAAGIASDAGNTIFLKGHVGRVPSGQVLTGTGIQLHVRK